MYSDQQRGETELNVMSNKHKDLSYDTHSIYDEIQDEDNKYEELTTDLYEPLEDRYVLSCKRYHHHHHRLLHQVKTYKITKQMKYKMQMEQAKS